jgi:hypothetical protein
MAAAVCYADIFEYPLKEKEVETFKINVSTRNKILNHLIIGKNGFYFLAGQEKLVQLRRKKESISKEKLKIAQEVVRLLSIIPTVRLIAVTGALAMSNCGKDDDIDILLVTKRGTIWTTRFISVIVLELFGKRRRPNDKTSSNKICMNMFVDENHLEVPKNEQDIFSAHEVAQIKVLYSRDSTDKHFWQANEWIRRYLPNAIDTKIQPYTSKNYRNTTWTSVYTNLIEDVLKRIQLWYMNTKRTTEIVADGYVRFHPHDARSWILPEYEKRLRKFGLK